MRTSHTVLEELILQELDVLHQLVGVLQDEQSQLVGTSIDVLEQIIPQKVHLVSKMEQLSQSRYSELGSIGFQPDETGMQAWLDSAKNDPGAIAVGDAWNELLSVTQNAKELNRVNGVLISSHMQRNQQALGVLHASAGNSVYGPDGQQKHNLTKANSVITG